MSDWDFRITAPNGTSAHWVLDGSLDDDALVSNFAAFLASLADNDVPADDPEKMTGPAAIQPVKAAR